MGFLLLYAVSGDGWKVMVDWEYMKFRILGLILHGMDNDDDDDGIMD